jgi:hypothetical protein
MHLLLRQSQRDDGWIWSSMTFLLDARLDLDAEEQYLFGKYRLYDRVVYNSEAFIHHLDTADQYREAAAAPHTNVPLDAPLADHITTATSDLAATAYNSFAALAHNILGKMALQITLQSLVDGIRVESEDLEEILTVAQLMQRGVEFLATYLQVSVTFDGREELSEY